MRISLSCFSGRAVFGAAVALVGLFCPSSAISQRLPSTVVPTHYTLKLTPDLTAATFSGEEAIDVNVKRAHADDYSQCH